MTFIRKREGQRAHIQEATTPVFFDLFLSSLREAD
jgi:hypothetical protein